jgi:Asp-tRNA(Asn)/Glu-tRNA(Gln) amidotransferase C subunit
MLAPMEIGLEGMKRMAAAGGFAWTDAELESLLPAVERLLDALSRLESLPLEDLEPTTQYRVL